MSQLKTVDLGSDEIESLRLADFLRRPQVEAAKSMGVSQSTFNRILAEARNKVATSLVEGCALRIGAAQEGHVVIVSNNAGEKWSCGRIHGCGRQNVLREE